MRSVPKQPRFNEHDLEALSQFFGRQVGRVVRAERVRHRRQLAVLWIAWALLALLVAF